MKYGTKKHNSYLFIIAFSIALGNLSCTRYLPEDRETVGSDTQFTVDVYQPILGRTTFFSDNFFKGSTSFPADFKIVNPRRRSGEPAPELLDIFPVKVWKQAYTGEETSLEEIEAKREIQNRPVFEIGAHSGTFTMWSEARSSFIRAQPDSGYLFDIELANSGGRRYFRNIKLMPFRERPFEPSNYDAISGQPLSNGVRPSVMRNIKGVAADRYLGGFDVEVYIRKLQTGNNGATGNSITFRFLDTLFHPINPDRFATTDWPNLIHGFNMRKTAESVTYDVAFPIPAVALRTRYTTSDGRRASAKFTYSRVGFGGSREDAELGLDFAIYEPGNWEIVFAFISDNPKFEND